MELRTANVTRYIMPLREGGSLPALAEADDEFKYVVKFRGAGHGTKALIAEVIGGEIARCLGFHVPEFGLPESLTRLSGGRKVTRRYKTYYKQVKGSIWDYIFYREP